MEHEGDTQIMESLAVKCQMCLGVIYCIVIGGNIPLEFGVSKSMKASRFADR